MKENFLGKTIIGVFWAILFSIPFSGSKYAGLATIVGYAVGIWVYIGLKMKV